MKIKFATKAKKSIWLIKHGETDLTKIKNYIETYKGQNYEWKLNEMGLTQSRRIATVLKEQYENFTNPPLIFASPFKRLIQTGLYTAHYVNSTLKIEIGLLEKKHHALWDETKVLFYFSRNLQLFDMKYKSKFPATKDKMLPLISDVFDIDRSVAYYFIDMLYTGNQDIIIIGHEEELYKIQKVITKDIDFNKAAFEKIGCASMFKYVLNPQSWNLELKSYYKVPDFG